MVNTMAYGMTELIIFSKYLLYPKENCPLKQWQLFNYRQICIKLHFVDFTPRSKTLIL